MSFFLDLVDEMVHRLGDAGKVAAKPLAVESGRHRFKVLRRDVDDAANVADHAVAVYAVDHWNELVVRVLAVFVVLAVLVAVVGLAVQEGDDERVLEPYLERVRDSIGLACGGYQVISKQRIAAGASDSDLRITGQDLCIRSRR